MIDKNISTEYTGVYTGIFPNMSPRELELEARVKDLERKLDIAESTLKDIATFDNYIVAQADAQQAL